MIRLLTVAAALLALTPGPALAVTLPDVEDEVMCVQCGTALNISQAPSAEEERDIIREDIAKGLGKDEIKQHLVAEYGPKVLAEPHQRASWLVPVLLAVLALGAVGLTVRGWRRTAELTTDEADGLDADAAARLERDMAAYDR